ncbi:endolytic transglycosylase MltG [Streptomyces sp. 549]|uniref:endolytic transglycosylase MltG n=1 Tax=Streptomyces sp. 549 TaxID=3049076 RepID=UPI0024C3BC1B|nr:endolytic transglycosylase MltG [Streptomyces sp. 549]MDK1472454.1 endolytic transglycosylase MltG [Streptomyces sp. 549]
MRKRWLVWAALGCVLVLLGVVLVVQLTDRNREAKRDDSLLVPEGRRASQVYTSTDAALGLDEGTTARAARNASLALPPEADGNPEGYLFPATYPVTDDTTASALLSFMVNTANSTLEAEGIPEAAKRHGLSTYEAVAAASIVQAEADTEEDMGRVARVIHNRLERDMPLQMDSTVNYALDRSSLDTSRDDTRIDSPYNTYRHRGLPPAPIGNPGREALRAVVDPPEGDWLYFVTVRPGDTRFTSDYAEHQRHVEEFNRERARARESEEE